MSYLYLIISVSLGIIIICFNISKQNISFNIEYLFFIIFIALSGCILISSTNLFSTIFVLELVALLIFGKFAVSRSIFKRNNTNYRSNTNIPQYSFGLFNSLFFQF